MKKYIIILSLIFCANIVKSQQLQSSSMYELVGLIHNPSTAGVMQDENTKATVGIVYRTQWSALSGSPKTVTAFGSFKLPKQKIGVGGYLYSDKTGPTARTGIELSLAKHINFNDGGVFSIGLESRLLQYKIDRAKLTTTLGADPALGTADTKMKYDAGFGISYTNKKLQIGASVSQLVQSKLDYYKAGASTTEIARLYRHYYVHGLYNINFDNDITVTPNAMVIYLPNAPFELQAGARMDYKKTIWWGLGYRLHQSFMLSAGLTLAKKFNIGYAYDSYNTPISSFDGGHSAHEFMLKFNLAK